jgi:phage gp36-like protein
MDYAAQSDMVNRFGNDEVVALTDRSQTGAIDPTVLGPALVTASAQIDTYLSGRYTLPLPLVPVFLATVCCDLARYHLCVGTTRLSEEINTRYKDAVRFLELAATGTITLGVTQSGQVQSGNTIEFNAGTKIFSHRDRGAY